MRKRDLIEIIFVIATMSCMIFSKNITVRIISAILIFVYVVVSKSSIYFKRKKLINDILNNQRVYMPCKETNYTFILCGFTLILNSINNITPIFNYKTGEIFINGEKEINGFIDFINRITIDGKVSIFVYTILIILGFVLIIEELMSIAIISDNKIIFYNGTIFYFSEITKIKYKKALFSSKKIIKLYKNHDEKKIILKLKDFEKVKNYLEVNIDL